MTEARFRTICFNEVKKLRELAPKRTGNLANNAVRYEFKGNECHIYVDEDIAPYMPFTNEKWISPKWNGKQNPNEEWWQKAIEMNIVQDIANAVSGEIR